MIDAIGPTPLKAVFVGKDLSYDCEFVISEVNADERTYVENRSTGKYELSKIDSNKVGPFILTKSLHATAPLVLKGNTTKLPNTTNLAGHYKPAVGSHAERTNADALRDSSQDGFRFSVRSNAVGAASAPRVGSECEWVVTAEASQPGAVDITMIAYSVEYTGKLPIEVKQVQFTGEAVAQGGKRDFALILTPDEYKGQSLTPCMELNICIIYI